MLSRSWYTSSRRGFLKGSAALGAASLVGVAPAYAAVNWKKFAGTTLEVLLVLRPDLCHLLAQGRVTLALKQTCFSRRTAA